MAFTLRGSEFRRCFRELFSRDNPSAFCEQEVSAPNPRCGHKNVLVLRWTDLDGSPNRRHGWSDCRLDATIGALYPGRVWPLNVSPRQPRKRATVMAAPLARPTPHTFRRTRDRCGGSPFCWAVLPESRR